MLTLPSAKSIGSAGVAGPPIEPSLMGARYEVAIKKPKLS
jgi:hypothetical protein